MYETDLWVGLILSSVSDVTGHINGFGPIVIQAPPTPFHTSLFPYLQENAKKK